MILKFNGVVMQRIFRHLCLRIAGFHLQLNFPSQSAHAIEFVDRISCAGKDGPSHHHKRDSHRSNFFLNAVAGHRKPGPKLARVLFIHKCMGLGHAGTPHPTLHSIPCRCHLCPGATTTAAEPRADGSPTPWQLESRKAI